MKKVFVVLILVLFLVAFLGTVLFLYGKSQESPVVYQTDQPFVTDIVRKTVATGSIVPRREVALKSRVPGVVDELYFEEGDSIARGDLVARIRLIPDMVRLNDAEAALEAARIDFEDAERELERRQELHTDNLISDFDFNRFKLEVRRVEQRLEAAQNNLDLIREGSARRSGNVSNLVESTVDGMVLDLPVKEGTFIIESNMFNEGTTIASVADMGEMIFEGRIDEAEVGRIAVGMDLILSVGAIEGETFNARLEFISPKGEVDQGAVKFDMRAAIELRETTFLRAGYSATADIVLEKRNQVLAIREGNLIFEDDRTFVDFMIGEQQFERREVQTGLSDGINIEIVGGLSEGDTIRKL
ncbi:MAG: efflux RND transporter periplasmic adaptor subunit [Gammaproteobacteria bacterium]|jgi:HlyD family secretion protein|nr:efflux RND transporter periplasmic adaptor subunit [Gammaproteobacteria bacterium]MDH3819857.1 efflux RND transporter periplasmic adaptor subunit [Gammaproteobacteria bacterium]MDH3983183.1 efflux RND transporter periplasmic adaptor subunit [Gammaproteobacteria bacterium]